MAGRIAVGVDGSPESMAAVDWAADEAALRKADLRVVSASHWDKHPNAVLPSADTEQDWGRRLLTEAEDRAHGRRSGLTVTTEEIEDAPATVLLAAAADADMLVLGSHGLGEAAAFVVGSVGQAAVAHARHPVVLVRQADSDPATRTGGEVVVGLDVRHPQDEPLEFAFASAERHGVTLRAVHAWHYPAAMRHVHEAAERRTRDAASEALSAVLRPWRRRFPGVVVTTDIVTGRAGAHLVSAAQRAGLLVVGRRARDTTVGPHVGAATHAVLHHAPCPVAVVPHG